MERHISIDIVICTYNNAALLDRTLEAISKQRVSPYINWRVLVVNNNCTDETANVVEKHLKSGEMPLRMVFETKQGLTPARVCGVRNTSADWVAFVDDDCLLAEDWVEQAATFAAEHPSCGAFGGRVTLEWETTPPPFVLQHRYAYAGKQHGEKPHRRSWLAGIGMVARREALKASGWIDKQFLDDRTGKQLISGGDMKIGLRIAIQYELWYNPNCRIKHIIPERRMSRQYLRRITRGLGASRHNANALTWNGSYASWLFYSAAFSIGFAVFGFLQLFRGAFDSGIDLKLSLSPAVGWLSAMWEMLQMNPSERRQLIGCAANRPR